MNATPLIEYTIMSSPIGDLIVSGSSHTVAGIHIMQGKRLPTLDEWIRNDSAMAFATQQLQEYFDGKRDAFDLKLSPIGTPFQHRVWAALCLIPYGATCSYGKLASDIGNPKASRAVGLANGRNPIPIVVPCHRVIGADGSLTGFGGGLAAKKWLLEHESGSR
jgi:methylated-DNA-[protein]-cysteine S-methyltransferase